MVKVIRNFFNSENFMPHGHCFLWQPDIFWLHLLSDSGIAAAYFAIPFVLIYLLKKRRDIPFERIFILFAAFILLCGMTHLMSIWVLWHPNYAAEGVLKLSTALTSIFTFFTLIKLIPRILKIPSPEQLAETNKRLELANHELELLHKKNKADWDSYLQVIVNTVVDGLIIINDKGIIQSFNPASVKIFGYQPEEVIGKNVKMLMPNPYHDEHDKYINNYLNTGAAKVIGIGREVTAMRKNNSIFPMELGISEFLLSGQRMFLGIIRDISERKAAEKEIAAANEKLKNSVKELESFTYIVSHDLRSPLVNLRGFASELQKAVDAIIPFLKGMLPNLDKAQKAELMELLETSIPKSLGFINNSVEKIDGLTSAVLELSRIGHRKLIFINIDVNDLVEKCINTFKFQIEEKNIQVEVKKLPNVVADYLSLQQVFGNIIDNAIKYLDPTRDGKIEIGGTREEKEIKFYVKDNGKGIAEYNIPKVFEIFRRLDNSTEVPGEGIGMAHVKAIIERHGGRIWCESAPGTGSIFFFTISSNLTTGEKNA